MRLLLQPIPVFSSRKYRYYAYRQFVRWAWQFLGKKIRVPIPSCVVIRIRERFPREYDEEYMGFVPVIPDWME